MHREITLIAVAALLVTGCTNMGPKTVPRDRFEYNLAISDSWKEQVLLNVVKMRYADMPLFLDVASIVSGYTLTSAVELGGQVSSEGAVQGDFLRGGVSGQYTDRPTITYAPITGQKFNQNFMTPVPPQAIMFLLESGWPAEIIFPLAVDTVNGLRSRVHKGLIQQPGDAKFYRLTELIGAAQEADVIGMRIKKDDEGKETTSLFFQKPDISPETTAIVAEVRELLGLAANGQEITVKYDLIPDHDREIAMLTRSMLQIMFEMAVRVDVPDQHIEEGRTFGSLGRSTGSTTNTGDLISIQHSEEPPENAFVSVRYRDYWFWIDDRDYSSKRTFSFLMFISSLNETGTDKGLPLVTIPTS